jgi:2-C-methyl-D-erythritol 4-phosphate cytidylyltransferase / 2-C-methyl-D-erythritol 2,4-cyclodiphosphate synthase
MAEVAVVVVAAGRGSRAGGDLPKQFRPIGGEPMIRRSLSMLVEHPEIGAVQPVIHLEDVTMFQSSAAELPLLPHVFGGRTRQSSVRAGLEALAPHKPDRCRRANGCGNTRAAGDRHH